MPAPTLTVVPHPADPVGAFDLSWTSGAVSSPVSFHVFFSFNPPDGWNDLGDLGSATTFTHFHNLDPGQAIYYYVRQDDNGTVTNSNLVSLTVPGMKAAGRYLTQDNMENVRGAENIRVWSRKGDTGSDTDVAAVQAAIDHAENLIDAQLRYRYPIPLTAPDGTSPITAFDKATLRDIAEPIATYELMLGRPSGVPNDERNSLSDQRRDAIARLQQYVAGTVYLDAPTSFAASLAPEVIK